MKDQKESNNVIQDKAYDFALSITGLYKRLKHYIPTKKKKLKTNNSTFKIALSGG